MRIINLVIGLALFAGISTGYAEDKEAKKQKKLKELIQLLNQKSKLQKQANEIIWTYNQDRFWTYLKKEGFSPKTDKVGDISFKKEGVKLWVLLSKKDPVFVRLAIFSLWEIDGEEERKRVTEVVTKLNREYKLIKFIIHKGGHVSVQIQMFVDSEENQKWYKRNINALLLAKKEFSQEMAK